MGLPAGKINPEILKSTVFNYLDSRRRDVIVRPSEGEDAPRAKEAREGKIDLGDIGRALLI